MSASISLSGRISRRVGNSIDTCVVVIKSTKGVMVVTIIVGKYNTVLVLRNALKSLINGGVLAIGRSIPLLAHTIKVPLSRSLSEPRCSRYWRKWAPSKLQKLVGKPSSCSRPINRWCIRWQRTTERNFLITKSLLKNYRLNSTSLILTVHGSVAPMRIPMAWCDSTYPRKQISRKLPNGKSRVWWINSTIALENLSITKHPCKSFNKLWIKLSRLA